jgi:hypothetical protein
MFQAVNSYTNLKQQEEEVKQKELMQIDLDKEKVYFEVICVLLGIITSAILIITMLKISNKISRREEKKGREAVREHERDIELKTIVERLR